MYKADRPRRHPKEIAVDGVLGIDIAKAKFVSALLTADGRLRHKSAANTPAGFDELAVAAAPGRHAGARLSRGHRDVWRRARHLVV